MLAQGLPGFQKDPHDGYLAFSRLCAIPGKNSNLIVPFWEIAAFGGAGCGHHVGVNMEHPKTCRGLVALPQ